MPHVVIWQAEFWSGTTRETFWIDFPEDVSATLEKHKHEADAQFKYQLRNKSLEEVPYMPKAKRARWEEGPDDNFVYWLFPGKMEQMNTVHGARRRLRRIFIEREELDRVSCWP